MADTNPTSDNLDFGSAVADYERLSDPQTLQVGGQVLKLIAVRPELKIADVAAGTSALAEQAALLGAKVLACDLEPKMVERASARLSPYAGSSARIMDFRQLDIASSSVDLALSLFGVLGFKNGREGIRELVRITKPRGQIVVAGWDQENTGAPQFLASDLYPEISSPPRWWPEDFFPLWPRQTLADALRKCGCAEVRVLPFQGEWLVRSPESVMAEHGRFMMRLPGYGVLTPAEKHILPSFH